jgi:site-specific DNA recombinase
VLEQLRGVLRAPWMVADVWPRRWSSTRRWTKRRSPSALTRLDAIWDQVFPAEQQRIVRLLVEKVIVSPNDIELRLRQTGIEHLALALRPAMPEEVAA